MLKNVNEKGFLKLSKNILEWQWYTDSNVSRLFLHILLKANFKPHNWQGHEINIGEFITSIDRLHVELNISVQSIKTALSKLERTNYIAIKPTNRFTLIKLLSSDVFSIEHFASNKPLNYQLDNNQQTSNNQSTTTNKEIDKIDFEERINIFQNEVLKFNNQFSNEVLTDFFNYYSQKNSQTDRAKFEEDKYWDTEKRLKTWKLYPKPKDSKKFTKNR
ncbi:hypothetical protein [Flavobacterium sp.]|uniref:hypothetical protein n=1 Tax=Flavobacterium sp. TaxID=239 RepID=UPI00391D85F2